MSTRNDKPNILFIMSDDHASHAMSCYGSRVNITPNLDRIANEGMRFDNCYCTNSICTPSRAAILGGTYNHVNGVTTLDTHMDNRLDTYPKRLRTAGYQTAIFGKWHLGTGPEHCPMGFDDWAVLPGQGRYFEPEFIFPGPDGGKWQGVHGYVTDIITDMSLAWLHKRDTNRPFCLMVHHKAPHREWESDEKHEHLFLNEDLPEPDNLLDDYEGRPAAEYARMRLGIDMKRIDVDHEIPRWLDEKKLRRWAYQFYMKKYLRCIASVDDNVSRLLDYLDKSGLADNTIVIYTSDQGFFLGDHGWFDKRFMYEESLKMPFLIRWPNEIRPGSVCKEIVTNVDFAPTFLDVAGVKIPDEFQGNSIRALLKGQTPDGWQQSMYYRYWMHAAHHNVPAHYGIRTKRYKLIYYYSDGCGQAGAVPDHDDDDAYGRPSLGKCPRYWELYDLDKDLREMHNIYDNPAYAGVVKDLKIELARLQKAVADKPYSGVA